MSRIIGIDLGTTNSCCAYINNGVAHIIPNSNGNNITPSVVSFGNNGEVFVGESALNMKCLNSKKTITGIKRKMGSSFTLNIDGKDYQPEIIASFILKKLKEDAENHLKEKISDAVITVPAYFSDAQRQATVDAGRIAGLNVLRIINEPTSASLAYGLDNYDNQNIVVYDLGGGTFDVSVLELENGVFEVKSTKGNNNLGGMDFDRRLVEFIISKFHKETAIDLSKDKLAVDKLYDEAERVKIELSDNFFSEIKIPFITADKNGPKHLDLEITRDLFENLIEEYIDETITLTENAIDESGFSRDMINKIILIGGSTRIPLIHKKLEEILGEKILRGINALEAVALGAAIQSGIISGDISGMVLVDIAPLSIGIESDGGVFVPIIDRNSPIPAEAKKVFTTVEDNQQEVEVHILQGERRYVKENTTLGKFILTGIKKAPKGKTQIEVTFSIDINSIVSVTARDIETGESKSIIVNARTGMSKDEIDKIIEESNINTVKPNDFLKIYDFYEEGKKIIRRIEKHFEEQKVDLFLRNDIESSILYFNKSVDEKDYLKVEKYLKLLKGFYEELDINDFYNEIENIECNSYAGAVNER